MRAGVAPVGCSSGRNETVRVNNGGHPSSIDACTSLPLFRYDRLNIWVEHIINVNESKAKRIAKYYDR